MFETQTYLLSGEYVEGSYSLAINNDLQGKVTPTCRGVAEYNGRQDIFSSYAGQRYIRGYGVYQTSTTFEAWTDGQKHAQIANTGAFVAPEDAHVTFAIDCKFYGAEGTENGEVALDPRGPDTPTLYNQFLLKHWQY